MYTIEKRIEDWFPGTCQCSFENNTQKLEDMSVDNDKLYKELILSSEWDLKLFLRSHYKPAMFHVENTRKILQCDNSKFEKLLRRVKRMFSEFPRIVFYLKSNKE